jgi:hypothetical protein
MEINNDQTHPSFRTYDMEIFCTLMEKHFHTIFNTYFKHKRRNTITCCSNVPSLVVHPCSLIWTLNVTIANHHVLCVSRISPQTKEPIWIGAHLHGPMHPSEPIHSSTIAPLGTGASQPWFALPFSFPHGWERPLARSCTQGSHFPN